FGDEALFGADYDEDRFRENDDYNDGLYEDDDAAAAAAADFYEEDGFPTRLQALAIGDALPGLVPLADDVDAIGDDADDGDGDERYDPRNYATPRSGGSRS